MPRSESCYDNSDDTRQNSEQDVVDRHEGLGVLPVTEDFAPDPGRRCRKTHPAEEGEICQEEDKGFVVAQANASREPRAVVVHLQDAALARGAVVGAVGLLGLALVAEAQFTGGCLDSEGRVLHLSSFLRRQMTVAILEIERRPGVGEYGGSVAPVEHKIEEDAEGRRELSYATCQ